MNLKYKIITLITGLLLTVSIITSFVNYRLDVNSAQRQLKNISLPLSIDNIYTEIQHRMIEPLLVSSLMSNNTFLKDWVVNGEKDLPAIQKYLAETQKKYSLFTTFLVSDKTKNYYHAKGLIDKINEDNKNDDWYRNFKNGKDEYEVNLDTNKAFGNTLIIFINYKVRDYQKRYIATAGVGIRLYYIEKMLDSFKKKYKYDVYFLNEDGEIILCSNQLNKRGNIANIDGLKKLKNNIFSKERTQLEYKNKDGDYLLSSKYVDELKLYLLVEVNKEEYLGDLQETFLFNLLTYLLVTFVVILIIIYAINIYQKQLEKLAGEDILTSLANRRKFNEFFENKYRSYRKKIKKFILILIDIDDFKTVNDSFGHLVGDQILVRIAELLREHLSQTDEIARWGGEEFAALFVDSDKEDAVKIAEKLRQAVKEDDQIIKLLGRPLTISIGLGEISSGENQDGLINKVDTALYEAKNTGKDKLVVV